MKQISKKKIDAPSVVSNRLRKPICGDITEERLKGNKVCKKCK